jgi:hypothetical protein
MPKIMSLAISSVPAFPADVVPVVVGGASKQKVRFSRAWVVAAAAAANFTYEIVADDERGVDMTIHSSEHTLAVQTRHISAGSRLLVVGDSLDPIHSLIGKLGTVCFASPPLRIARAACSRHDVIDDMRRQRLAVMLNEPVARFRID